MGHLLAEGLALASPGSAQGRVSQLCVDASMGLASALAYCVGWSVAFPSLPTLGHQRPVAPSGDIRHRPAATDLRLAWASLASALEALAWAEA